MKAVSPGSVVVKIVNPLPNTNTSTSSTFTSTSQRKRGRSSEISSTSNQSQEGDENELNDHDLSIRVATGVLCVIQVTVDCFLKNMMPVVYLDACFCSDRGKLICAM